MRKLVVSMLVAFLLASGLVATTGSSASAVRCPYTGCVKTATKVSGPAQRAAGKRVRFRLAVTTAGNARPRGAVKIKVRRQGGGFFRAYRLTYSGPTTFNGPALRRHGRYLVVVKFRPSPRAAFASSVGVFTTQVSR